MAGTYRTLAERGKDKKEETYHRIVHRDRSGITQWMKMCLYRSAVINNHQSAETISAVQAILFPVHARADLAVVV